jgi:hypothetical protein
MIDAETRKCDICGSVIPKGTTYRVARIAPDKVALLLDIPDFEILPTWTQETDGNVRIDICLECHISMGGISSNEAVH